MSAWDAIRRITAPEHARFVAYLDRPDAAQARQLRDILAANAESVFGRRHRFHAIEAPPAFLDQVPPQDPDDLQTEMTPPADGGPGRLCAEPIVAYERTAGTRSGSRFVPYTEAGLAAFRRAVYPWLHDLLAHRPGIAAGRAYWSVSPAGRRPAHCGVRRATDADYFGPDTAPLIDQASAAPAGLCQITDIARWRYLLLRHLVAAEDLSLVSVWSPTFLSGLLAGLVEHGDRLAEDLARGGASGPSGDDCARAGRFAPRPDRSEVLLAALSASPPDLSALWPRLDTVSCWTHGSAARFVPELARALPRARFQGKGLLATEAAISIPVTGHRWPVLALNSGFFEFVDASGTSLVCGQVEDGETYRLRVTTHSGLYRYELGDQVRIRGFLGGTPALEFLGRGSMTSDLVGEKLTDDFVTEALGGETGFAMLAPVVSRGCRYVLFLDSVVDGEAARARAAVVDRRLTRNPHYRYARELGQLGPVTVVRVASAMERYQAECLALGQRLGDIKPPALRPETDWLERLMPDSSRGPSDRAGRTTPMEARP